MRTLKQCESLFLTEKIENHDDQNPTVLWIPPLKTHHIANELDWALRLQISRLFFEKPKTWNSELSKIVEENKLPLDKLPEVDLNYMLFKLPEGFVANYGLIVKNCNWSNSTEVIDAYSKTSYRLGDPKIQCFDIWNTEFNSIEGGEVEWIKLN